MFYPIKALEAKEIQSKGYVKAMVGDGINGTPALAQTDVGVVIGTGTDVEVAATSIALRSGDLNGVTKASIYREIHYLQKDKFSFVLFL